MHKRSILFACALFATSVVAPFTAQYADAQNIVTIFGQEKIEKTDEGEVFFTFREGMLLPGGTNQGTLFNGQDMIAWLYATGRFETPTAGDSIPYSYPNATASTRQQIPPQFLRGGQSFKPLPAWTWSPIQVDSTNTFRSLYMRMAYLYTAYESPREQIALLETTGGTRAYVNGFPHEGDHYDFGYTLIPIKLKKGLNEFVNTPGRFGTLQAKLVKPDKPVLFTKRDMTVPDLIIGENDAKWAAIRVVNTTEKTLKGLTLRATLATGEKMEYKTDEVMPLSVRKVKYQLPALAAGEQAGEMPVTLELIDRGGKLIDKTEIKLRKVLPSVHHERTFVSQIEGSVQYYSVAPAKRNAIGETKAMVLSVHGAGVEARNQARAYKPKDWTDVVAATNRRPYGFNWEEWGRADGLEVLEEAKRIYQPDPSRIYLTGHSMGGHGTWYLGTTYPDKFAAIAPCAGYPDISTYGSGRSDKMHTDYPLYQAFQRSSNPGRTLTLIQNLKQSGVYIFHGDEDRVVPTDQARRMRQLLGEFHADFCYYEYPGGEHWFGDHSVDWQPIFDYFKWHTIPACNEVKEIDFHTASPGVSASDYWVKVEQQVKLWDFSNIKVKQEKDTIQVEKAENVALFVLDLPALTIEGDEVTIRFEEQTLTAPKAEKAILALTNDGWVLREAINPKEKNSTRYGGFKYAYYNNVVLVYGTKGNKQENEWNMSKARFDAETFYYRANGSFEVIADSDFSIEKYKDRNVVLYGNKDNNRAWNLLLKNCPIQVSRNQIQVGDKNFKGDDLAAYFTYPHPLTDTTLVGVVAGTGVDGMRATTNNNYISGITGFPDLMIYRADMLKDGLEKVEAAGYFDNDWTLSSGDF